MEKIVHQRLLSARSKELLPFRPHACDSKFCDPQNESALIKRGLLVPATHTPGAELIYLCKYGQLHACSPATCTGDGYCTVSGAMDGILYNHNSSYDKRDARTWRLANANPKKRKVHDEKVAEVVDALLYSPKRNKLREDMLKKRAKKVRKDQEAYAKLCIEQHVPFNYLELAMIGSKFDYQVIEVLERNQSRIDQYTSIIMQLQEHITRITGETPQAECITLAVMYKMRQGLRIDDTQILPLDPFLAEHLPLMNDLAQLGLQKRRYTQGEHCIQEMIDTMRKKKLNFQDITIVMAASVK